MKASEFASSFLFLSLVGGWSPPLSDHPTRYKTITPFCFIVLFTAPAPSNVQSILATKCLDHSQNKSQFFYVRPAGGCDKIDELHGPEAEAKHLTDRNVVFVFQVKLDFI